MTTDGRMADGSEEIFSFLLAMGFDNLKSGCEFKLWMICVFK
jgi:hypothetical protein